VSEVCVSAYVKLGSITWQLACWVLVVDVIQFSTL